MDIFRTASVEEGLSPEEIKAALLESLEGRDVKNALILPPDFTRFTPTPAILPMSTTTL